MDNKMKYIGKSIPIHDAKEKATGKTKYVGDMKRTGMLYARLLLSNIAHGKIKKIDTSKAEALEGVVKIYTYANTTNIKYNSHIWYSGMESVKDETLFTYHVRHIGDRVAAVVATDKATAEYAVSLIEVEYYQIPAVINSEEALKAPDSILFSKEIKSGDAEAVIKDCEIVVEDTITTQKVHHGAMESHVCLSDIEEDGSIIIWTPCQVAFQVRLIICQVLQMPLNKIRVIKSKIGGSFGGKGQPILEPICAYFTKDLGVPVKLLMDRKQCIVGTRTRTATKGKVKTAVKKDGTILAREIEMLVDAGAYYTNGQAVTMAMGKKAFRLYKIKNQSYKGTAVYTNTPVGGACRGYGSPQIHALTEINIDNVARHLEIDPAELRIKNLVQPYDKDYTNAPSLGNARIIDCVKKGIEEFNWKSRRQKPKKNEKIVRGVGMACATHGNGYFGAFQDFITMSLRMNEDGELHLSSGIHDLGCGTVTTMKQIVAEVLDIETDKILVPEADTSISPFDSAGTQASRVTFVCGTCAKKTAEELKNKLVEYSAKVLSCDVNKVVIENGTIYNTENKEKKYTYSDMIIEIQNKYYEDISVSYQYKSQANPGVYAVNFVEVEIDKLTGMVKVIEVLAVHDIGKAINPSLVEGQIHGALQMGIGFALTEQIDIDKHGNTRAIGFSKYHVVNAPDMPKVKVMLIEEGEEHGPFGAKSVGEISTVAIAPAIINAINYTLDVNISSLPATPERILMELGNKVKNNKIE